MARDEKQFSRLKFREKDEPVETGSSPGGAISGILDGDPTSPRSSLSPMRVPVGTETRATMATSGRRGIASIAEPSYTTTPTQNPLLTADKVLRQIVNGEGINPFATNKIMASLDRWKAMTPEVSYVLSHPDIVEEWQSAMWTGAMDAMMENFAGDTVDAMRGRIESHDTVQTVFANHGDKMSPEERELLITMLAAMPDAAEIQAEKGVRNYGGGLWGNFRTGWDVILKAPETIRGAVNDTRWQLAVQANDWLDNNPLDTPEQKANFFNFIGQQSLSATEDVEAMSQGFFRLMEQTVGFIPDVWINEGTDVLTKAADPEGFGSRQYLSAAQNVAFAMGVDPAEPSYQPMTGVIDGFLNVVADPQNVIFGLGAGMKAARNIPRTVSRAQALRYAAQPIGSGKHLRLPLMNRGIVPRFTYALMSRTADDMLDAPDAKNLINFIAGSTSMSEIGERVPSLKTAEHTLSMLAGESDPAWVREILRHGMHGAPTVANEAPLIAERSRALLAQNADVYRARRAEVMADPNASLFSLDARADRISALDVYEVPKQFDVTAEKMRPDDLMGIAEFDRNALPVTPRNVSALEESIRARGFDPDMPVKVEYNRNLDQIMVTDGHHRLAAALNVGLEDVPVEMIETAEDLSTGIGPLSRGPRRLSELGDAEGVFRRGALQNSGDRKAVLSAVGRAKINRGNLQGEKTIQNLNKWLDRKTSQAASNLQLEIASSVPLGRMSDDSRRLLTEWGQAAGLDVLHLGDEAVMTPRGSKMVIEGADSTETAIPLAQTIGDDYFNYTRSFADNAALKADVNRHLWVVKDIKEASLTAQTRRLVGRTTNWNQGLRRTGFQFTHKLPQNITMTSGATGAQELRNWVKALGGSDELAFKWGDRFLSGTPANRKVIILDALREVGDEIENPMLREGLIQFGEKQGQYTYMFDRHGRELGLTSNGSIMPMTITHFSDEFAMPDAQKLIRSIKRYRQARPGSRMTRGFIQSTKDERARLARNLRAKMKRVNGVEVSQYSDEDWLAMAYADVLGEEWGRGSGMGYVSKAARVAAKPYQVLHSVFTVAQLAGRPIAWASRVLMEETVRADLMGMPSLWSNPAEYIARVWDAHQIRKMPDDLRAQAKVVDGLLGGLFVDGVDVRRLNEVIPGFDDILRRANVDPTDTGRVQSLASSIIGREMMGGDALTQGQLGLRGNITRRALLRDRRIRGHKARLDKFGLTDNFNWKIDGKEIANRTFWQQFMSEAESATIPMEWSTIGMTPRGITAYGRGYGRQIMQQLNDPIVGGIGVNRAIARALGEDTSRDALKLTRSPNWGKVQHIVDRKLTEDGITLGNDIAKAQWYLDNVVDEIIDTLVDPLAKGDPLEKARILGDWKNGGTTNLEVGGVNYRLSMQADNYEPFVNEMSKLAQSAFDEGLELPAKMSVYLDPRFGQSGSQPGFFRRAADATMQVFGEEASQFINRQPAFLDVHKRYFEQFRRMGWDKETAQIAATEKAAELVNYVFFSNKDIPQFLKSMNRVVPFFSAFWEVGSTWAYKIPSVNILPVGHAHLARRVQRAYWGLLRTGLVSYDPEQNRMTLNISEEMKNAKPGAAGLGRAMYEMTRLPVTLAEWTVGMGRMIGDTKVGDGIELGEFDAGDFSAWTKDGFSLAIGNPIDPTSHGIMAVNQFSIGLTPALQLPASMGARAVFDGADEKVDTQDMSVSEFVLEYPDTEFAEVLRWNREKFVAANGEEKFNRAVNGDLTLGDLEMPPFIELPNTSFWGEAVNRTFFPFGRMNHPLEVISSVSPAAMNHVWRGLFHQAGIEPDSDFMGYFFGQLSNYQVASELISQVQMVEASEGLLTRSVELSTELQQLVTEKQLDVAADPNGATILLDPDQDGSEEFHLIKDELEDINMRIWKKANDNTGWALLTRGVLGQLLPATPRMWDQQQQFAQEYWSTRDLAVEAQATGSANFAALQPVAGDFDIVRLSELTNAWINDSSGDEAKRWMLENNPGLLPFTQGKTFWGPSGPPPESEGFDKWVEELERGERKALPAEVWMRRYQGAVVSTERQIAIVNEFGNDPDLAAQTILGEYDRYRTVTQDFDAAYDALDFLDRFVYEGKYRAWLDREGLDGLSEYELVRDRARRSQEELDNITDILEFGDLSPEEFRRIRGILNSTTRELNDSISEARALAEEDETWRNPLEQIIGAYFDEVATPYWDGRNTIFSELEFVETPEERSAVFDAVREYDNAHYFDAHSIRSPFTGAFLNVPNEIVRSWNGKEEQERQERMVAMIGKKPEWLNQFEVSMLTQNNPQAAQFLPTDPQQTAIYTQISQQKEQIRALAAANPEEITQSQRDKALRELDDGLLQWLVDNGRSGEAAFREALPIQKVDMLGLLPNSLQPVVPMVNQINAELRASDESPTTEAGRRAFLRLRDFMETSFFPQSPQAEVDFDELAVLMFNEPLRSAAYARLLQGDLYGYLD